MIGVTVVVPLSSPIVSVIPTGPGGLIVVRLTLRAITPTMKVLVPVCLMTTFRLIPLITPTNVKYPGTLATNEPGGMVMVKLPIWSVTGSVGGLMPLLPPASVKLPLIEKPGWFGYSVSTAVKAPNCCDEHALKKIGSGLAMGPPNAARLAT